MKYIAIVGGVLWLAACSSVAPVTPAGKDTYIVQSKKSVDESKWVRAKAAATDRAVDFCDKQKKDMQEVGAQPPAEPGPTPQKIELNFKCVARTEAK